MSEITSQNEAVPARAAEWIGNVLRDAGVPASGSLLLAMEDYSDLDLRLLNGTCWGYCRRLTNVAHVSH